jgi:O-6-methylguanine DNA methyltransferase
MSPTISPGYHFFLSPLGGIELCSNENGLTHIWFAAERRQEDKADHFIEAGVVQLQEYFASKRTQFELPLDLQGTDFQKRVWAELQNIPFGETVSYLHISKALGDAGSTRAVGNANGKNPAPIVVPCHRVIGSNGSLVGYSGGIDKKKWLLEFERNLTQKDLFN